MKPRLKGRGFLVRYADDAVLLFSREEDARRVMEVLPKRFERYGLTLHPGKTRLVPFPRPGTQSAAAAPGPKSQSGSFDLLGFRHYWGLSWRGNWVVKRTTMPSRFGRALRKIARWCRANLHQPIAAQHRMLWQKLRGHNAYYGITGNRTALQRFRFVVARLWRKWLSRRHRRGPFPWQHFQALLQRFPLPPPIVVHSVYRRAVKP